MVMQLRQTISGFVEKGLERYFPNTSRNLQGKRSGRARKAPGGRSINTRKSYLWQNTVFLTGKRQSVRDGHGRLLPNGVFSLRISKLLRQIWLFLGQQEKSSLIRVLPRKPFEKRRALPRRHQKAQGAPWYFPSVSENRWKP